MEHYKKVYFANWSDGLNFWNTCRDYSWDAGPVNFDEDVDYVTVPEKMDVKFICGKASLLDHVCPKCGNITVMSRIVGNFQLFKYSECIMPECDYGNTEKWY
jgi:hypothetical protein